MYKVKYSKQSVKALRKMPVNWAKRICEKIDDFAKLPIKNNQIKPLKGMNVYRLRVGNQGLRMKNFLDILNKLFKRHGISSHNTFDRLFRFDFHLLEDIQSPFS